MSKKILVMIMALLIFDAAVGLMADQGEEEDSAELSVVITIPPQKEFVEEVGGDRVDTIVMIPPGEEPHSYEPSSSVMREVAEADVYFKVGSGMEFELTWMSTIKDYNPDIKIIDGSEGIGLREIGGDDSDDGHNKDPHIWMSPKNAIQMVKNLRDGLVDADDENGGFYEEGASDYIQELQGLHSQMEDDFADYEGDKFLVYHPSFGYLADQYNLTQIPIQAEGKDPGTKGLQSMIDQAKDENITVIFVSPQFDKSNAETIADAIGGEVSSINPLDQDYIDNIRKIHNELIEGLRRGEG